MNLILPLTLPVPLSQDAHRFARQFALEQATPEKGKQVYLNTLAVVALRDYLRWLSISTAIDQGDCWQPAKRAMFNVADLVLPHLGKLECIPILPNQNYLEIPTEVADQRLGYIAVQFSEELKQVELLGFVPAQEISHPPEPIPLSKLHSLDDLIDHLNWHRKWANLWQDLSQPEWQPLELLPSPNTRSLKATRQPMRNSIKLESLEQSFIRGKVIEWENNNTKLAFLLRVKVSEQSTEEVHVNIRLDSFSEESTEEVDVKMGVNSRYSLGENTYLPAGLEVSVLDESGVVCMQNKAGEADQWIELEFGCQPQEKFSLQIILNENKMIENFQV